MRNVAIAHNQTMVADIGNRAPTHRATVQRCVLADDVVIAHHQPRRLAGIGKVLRRAAQEREREDRIVFADLSVALDEDMRDQPRAIADAYVRTDHTARTDLHIGAKLGALIDNGRWMNFCAHVRSPLVAANSQSLASCPFTSTRPRNLKMLRRWNSTSTGISMTS